MNWLSGWEHAAACSGWPQDLWAGDRPPPTGRRGCASCPVNDVCLLVALDNDVGHGMFGGLSARQRARLGLPWPSLRVSAERQLAAARRTGSTG